MRHILDVHGRRIMTGRKSARKTSAAAASFRSGLLELQFEQILDLSHGLRSVVAVRVNGEFSAWAGCQHEQSHDARAVYLLPVFLNKNVATKSIRGFNE